MKDITASISNSLNRFGLAGSAVAITLGSLVGPMAQTVEAQVASCYTSWSQVALAALSLNLGHIPEFYRCFEMTQGASELQRFQFSWSDALYSDDYVIAAECDHDCNDMDLKVYDDNGQLLGWDISANSFASVPFNNIVVGKNYWVKMTMHDCDSSFCGAVLSSSAR